MKNRLLAILLSVFMVLGIFANVVHASDLGDNPTIHDVLRTRPDFALANNDISGGWWNSNNYVLFCQYGEYSDLSLSHNGGYSNEIKVNQANTTTKVGNNYKITITDGVQGGDLDLLFVMNDSNVLDYIEVTAPNSPDVAGIYGKTLRHMKDYLPSDEESAWTNDNGYALFYDSDNSKIIVKNDSTTIEILDSGLLTYSNNTYKYSSEGKTLLFNLEYEPSCTSVWLNDISISGYGASTVDGTYTLIHAGQTYWINEWGGLTSDALEKMFKVQANNDAETFTLVEVKSEKLGDELYLPNCVYTPNYNELAITSIADNVFSNTNITHLEIYNVQLVIGNNAFKGCSSLKDVYIFSNEIISLETAVFDNCSNNLVIHVPKGSLNAYKTNSAWLPYKDRIQPIYMVDDIINTDANFPRFYEGVLDGLLWVNESGAIVRYEYDGEYGCLVFVDETESYYYAELYSDTILDKKDDGNFEVIDFYGVCTDFIMENEVLTSITISNIENYDSDCSALNGTYVPVVTIASLLDTVEGGFPTIEGAGWINENEMRVYKENDIIHFDQNVNLSEVLEKDGNNYKYVVSGKKYTFVMTSGVLTSIKIEGVTGFGVNFNGEFYPYHKYTNGSISKPVGYTEDVEFITNATFFNDSDVTVMVDGVTLYKGTDYELASGSTHVTLKGAYVSTLEVGMHTITINVVGYGSVKQNFEITGSSPSPKKPKNYIVPNTGIR